MSTMTKEFYVGKLLCKANEKENKEAADVLKEYKATQDRDANIFKIDKKSKTELMETVIFLSGTEAADSPEMKDELKKNLKIDLATKVVNRIENLQPHGCEACSKDYYFELTDMPRLKCMICQRGACQECYAKDEEIIDKLVVKNRGMFFMCSSCRQPDPKDVREVALPRGRKGKTAPAPGQGAETAPTQGMEAETSALTSNEVIEGVSDEEEEEEDDDFQLSKEQRKKMRKLEKKKKKDEESKGEDDEKKSKGKCRFFMTNKCKFGVSGDKCPFFHPKRCSKWMKEGKEGCKKCDLFHPALCYGSLNEKKCDKPSCSYIHLPGTVRKPMVTADKENSCPEAGKTNQKKTKFDCIMCPARYNSEEELNHHINTQHSHKCNMCRAEFSYRQDLEDHHQQAHRPNTNPSAGGMNKHFLAEKPQEVEGQSELLLTVNSMVEAMKQSQQQNQSMMALIAQLVQQQKQPQVGPVGWTQRMPGQ